MLTSNISYTSGFQAERRAAGSEFQIHTLGMKLST